LKADAGWSDARIAEALDMSIPTVQRLRQRFVEEGLDVALGARTRKPRPYARKLDGEQEARLVALACSQAPEGHTRWTLRLLAGSGDLLEGEGVVERRDLREAYIADLVSRVRIGRPLKIVLDPGNGTAALFCEEVFRRAGVEVVPLFCDPDPTFPNHFPNPSDVAAREAIRAKVMAALGPECSSYAHCRPSG